MNLKEFRKIITSHNKSEEQFKNDFYVITDFVKINDKITIRQPKEIRVIKTGRINVLWIDDISIDLKDVTELRLREYQSYL